MLLGTTVVAISYIGKNPLGDPRKVLTSVLTT